MKITVNEAAEILGVSGARVRKLIDDQKLKAEKIGRDWMVSKASVLARKKLSPKPGRPKPKD